MCRSRLILALIVGLPCATAAAVPASLEPAAAAHGRPAAVTLIDRGAGSEWRYLDDGT
jgi:hypothetical protein